MSEKPISPLRQRRIEDMTVRSFVEKTRNDYIRQVKTFTAFLSRSPIGAPAERYPTLLMPSFADAGLRKRNKVVAAPKNSRRFIGLLPNSEP